MKKSLLSFVVLLATLSSSAFAQDASSPVQIEKSSPTKLGAFLGKKGLLVMRDIFVAGRIVRWKGTGMDLVRPFPNYKEMYEITRSRETSWAEVTAITVYEPDKEADKVKGLQINVVEVQSNSRDIENLCFLDLDEANDLSNAIDYLIKVADKWKGKDVGNKESYFITKDDFKVAVNQFGARNSTFFIIGGRLRPTMTEMLEGKNLIEFKVLVDNGIEWLKKQ